MKSKKAMAQIVLVIGLVIVLSFYIGIRIDLPGKELPIIEPPSDEIPEEELPEEINETEEPVCPALICLKIENEQCIEKSGCDCTLPYYFNLDVCENELLPPEPIYENNPPAKLTVDREIVYIPLISIQNSYFFSAKCGYVDNGKANVRVETSYPIREWHVGDDAGGLKYFKETDTWDIILMDENECEIIETGTYYAEVFCDVGCPNIAEKKIYVRGVFTTEYLNFNYCNLPYVGQIPNYYPIGNRFSGSSCCNQDGHIYNCVGVNEWERTENTCTSRLNTCPPPEQIIN